MCIHFLYLVLNTKIYYPVEFLLRVLYTTCACQQPISQKNAKEVKPTAFWSALVRRAAKKFLLDVAKKDAESSPYKPLVSF